MHAMKVRAMSYYDREVDGLIEINLTNSYVLDALHIGSISHYESSKIWRSGKSETPKKDVWPECKSLIALKRAA